MTVWKALAVALPLALATVAVSFAANPWFSIGF